MVNGYRQTFMEWFGKLMGNATKPGLDILQLSSVHISEWVKDIELESAIAFLASVYAWKISHASV